MYGIYFDITSDFGHFRNPFTLSFFETFLAPPRTTILGIIGAAMGLNEKKTAELSSYLRVGVRILDIRGFSKEIIIAYNYKMKPPERTPIMREILVEPMYRIYLGSGDKDLLENIIKALMLPKYPLYMGISEFLARVTKISNLQQYHKVMEKHFSCIIPANSRYKVKINPGIGKKYFPPRKYKTVYSYEITKNGRKPKNFVNVLMFFGYEIELEKPINAFKTMENEVIYLL